MNPLVCGVVINYGCGACASWFSKVQSGLNLQVYGVGMDRGCGACESEMICSLCRGGRVGKMSFVTMWRIAPTVAMFTKGEGR